MENRLAILGITASDPVIIMVVNTFFGIILGWLYWKLGLECAMFSHLMIDAVASALGYLPTCRVYREICYHQS